MTSSIKFALLFVLATLGNAFAQSAPTAPEAATTPITCARPATAPQWMPCAPDRVLSEAEMRGVLFRQGHISRIELTGGLSGHAFSIALKPGGQLDFGWTGGANLGRDWKVNGNKLCLRTYIREWRGQYMCGPAELLGGKLLLWDESDASKNVLNSVTFITPHP